MKKFEGIYKKEDGSKRKVNVYILEDSVESYKGIDLERLNVKEQDELIKLIEEFELKLKPYFKAFRNFKKRNFIAEGF